MLRLILLLIILAASNSFAQTCSHNFSFQDTLRGSITAERAWWDLRHYKLSIEVFPESKSIIGSNKITYKVIASDSVMQIDLQQPLTIEKVIQNEQKLNFKRNGNAYFIQLIEKQEIGKENTITIHYTGTPTEAKNAPWDGGFTWTKDNNGIDFIATSCQGIGASIWWPCKDHMYDEPENGMTIIASVPNGLVAIANGRLINEKPERNSTTFTWEVKNPINNYGVNLNIGDYQNFTEQYDGLKGKLDMSYWVLSYNLEKAKEHFKEAPRTIEAFEHWMGPYPFYEDSYKLVETPYLGMEHQSSVTYGNGFQNGYLGKDRSQTGWGNKFDFIIIHETGHEWFANNITYKDMADMWIHESFTAYSESLFLEYFYGKEAGNQYNRGKRSLIQNKVPMIACYDVNAHPPGDIYPKGANMLHTLRQIVNDDEKWRNMIIGLNKTFYHTTVTTHEIEKFIADFLHLNLTSFFDQYLRDNKVPTFQYRIIDNILHYKWVNCIPSFDMPLKVKINKKEVTLSFKPNGASNTIEINEDKATIKVDPNYYIYTHNIMGEN